MQRPEIDYHINQRILVGDSLSVAKFGALNTQFFGLSVDALGGGAVFVEFFEVLALAVELVTQSGAFGSSHCGDAAPFLPVFVSDRASVTISGGLVMSSVEGKEKGAGVATHLMFDFGWVADVGGLERHRQAGFAKEQALRVKLKEELAPFGKGNSGKAPGSIEVFVNEKVSYEQPRAPKGGLKPRRSSVAFIRGKK